MSVSFCPSCGAPLPPKTAGVVRNFCPKCGARLEDSSFASTGTRGQNSSGITTIIDGEHVTPLKHNWSLGKFFLPLIILIVLAYILSYILGAAVGSNIAKSGIQYTQQELEMTSQGIGYLCFFITALIWTSISFVKLDHLRKDLNTIASPYDHLETPSPWMMLIPFYPLMWYHKMSNRVGNELQRRGFEKDFDCNTFWIWFVLAAIIIIIGNLVYYDRLFKAMNKLAQDYNANGR